MQVVQSGYTFRTYDDSVKTYAGLPAGCYDVNFDKQTGFFLSKHDDIEINEKVYGVHLEKTQKVLNAFSQFQRNLGVVLSGDKGIGKSLFAKVLANEGIKQGLPLIIVNTYVPGIADYLQSMNQEMIVLFDEFEKTFGRQGDMNPQVEMLTLFDGISTGKKLYVITCNEIRSLNDFLINRPGRFHYHFRFEYPTSTEIEEYLHDKLDECYYGEIEKVITFARRVNLSYDCLRAIAFELQNGLAFEVAIKDLNILHLDSEKFNLRLHFEDGSVSSLRNQYLDSFSDETLSFEFQDPVTKYWCINLTFTPCDSHFCTDVGSMIIDGDKIGYEVQDYYNDSEDEKAKEVYTRLSAAKPKYLSLHRVMSKSIHYTV